MRKSKQLIRAPVITLPATVLFPWTLAHIEITDKLHLTIIKDAVKNGSNIVINLRNDPFLLRDPLSSHSNQKMNAMGTIGKPIVINETYEAFTKVVIKGIERVVIKDLVQNLPFPIYEVELCPDLINNKSESIVPQNKCIEKLANLIQNWGERNIQNSLDRDNFFSNMENLNHLVYNIATHLVDDCEIKQILLETLNLNERLQILSLLFPNDMVDREDPLASIALKEYEAIESKILKSQ